jgi:O-antigen biosynthesis protein
MVLKSTDWQVARKALNPVKRLLRTFGIPRRNYSKWVRSYSTITSKLRPAFVADIARWPSHPLISVAMTHCKSDSVWLRQSIESVREQIYPHWQLCTAGDTSTAAEVQSLLKGYAAQDSRIQVRLSDEHGDQSVNGNAPLTLAQGDYIALMNADDLLSEDALFWMAREIAIYPDTDLLFSDEDKVDHKGKRFDPYFKSAWNPALMLSQNAFSRLGVYRRSIVEQVGRFREGYEGAEEYDLVLRCCEQTNADHIRHIPRVLYHRMARSDTAAPDSAAKSAGWQAGQAAIADHLQRSGINARVAEVHGCYYQVQYDAPRQLPLVSIVIPTTLSTAITAKCLRSVLTVSSYNNFEVFLLVHTEQLRAAEANPSFAEILTDGRVRLIGHEEAPFNFSRISNLGSRSAAGEFLCFLNDDIEVLTSGWLERLVARAILDDVGAVGAMLYYPSGSIQHAGVLLGVNNVADHPFNSQPRGSCGYFGRAALEQDYSCVTAACLLVRRKTFDSVGGFDEALPTAFNDIDLCVRVRRTGARIVWTPSVEMIHRESHTFGPPDAPRRHNQHLRDIAEIRQRWEKALDADPCYNPNLSLRHDSMFLPAWPPRVLSPMLIIAADTMLSISRTSQLVA